MKQFLLKELFIAAAIFTALFGFLIGIAAAHSPDGCKYTSILSRINLGYVVGCELSRPRFEPYK